MKKLREKMLEKRQLAKATKVIVFIYRMSDKPHCCMGVYVIDKLL